MNQKVQYLFSLHKGTGTFLSLNVDNKEVRVAGDHQVVGSVLNHSLLLGPTVKGSKLKPFPISDFVDRMVDHYKPLEQDKELPLG